MDYDTDTGLKHRILIFADPDDENEEVQIARIGKVSNEQETLFRVFPAGTHPRGYREDKRKEPAETPTRPS